MADAAPLLTGDALLEAVSESMAVMHERYYHRRPMSVATRLMTNELLACVMGDHTDVEQAMVDLERQTVVQETRSAFQDAMGPQFVSEVERLSGRRVLMFVSNSHVGPDLAIELFVLAPAA